MDEAACSGSVTPGALRHVPPGHFQHLPVDLFPARHRRSSERCTRGFSESRGEEEERMVRGGEEGEWEMERGEGGKRRERGKEKEKREEEEKEK